jgi:hypothetical protein
VPHQVAHRGIALLSRVNSQQSAVSSQRVAIQILAFATCYLLPAIRGEA